MKDRTATVVAIVLVLLGCCGCAGLIWWSTGQITNDDVGSLLGMAVIGFMVLVVAMPLAVDFIRARLLG